MYRLLPKLPQGSRYKAAVQMNMELAKRILDEEERLEQQSWMQGLLSDDEETDPETESPTSSVGHTFESELIMKLIDWAQVINSTLIGVNLPKGKRPPRVRPHPRPVSAVQVLRRQREKAAVQDMLSDLGLEPDE